MSFSPIVGSSSGEPKDSPLYFIGVDHLTDWTRFHDFAQRHHFCEGESVYIEDSVHDEISGTKLHHLKHLPHHVTVKCWDDPTYCRQSQYLTKVRDAYTVTINPKSHSDGEVTSATLTLKEFYADYCSEKQTFLAGLCSFWRFPEIKPFPDPATQSIKELFESRAFIHRAIDEKRAEHIETFFLKRQEKLCESITLFDDPDNSAYWIAGSAHFTGRLSSPQSYKAEKMFLDAVGKIGRTALRIDLS